MASLGAGLIAVGCGSKSSPEDSLHRFVESINGAEFNHAYQELSGRCQAETSLDRFQKTYGKTLLSYGIGGGGLAGNGTLKANDVMVARTDDYHAEVTLDWVI